MKNLVFALFVLFGLSACDKEEIVAVNDLPEAASQYINTHFAGEEVAQVVKDRDGARRSYEVQLKNGVELEFTKDGVIKSVESKRNDRLPNSVIPAKLLGYVQTNFPDDYIVAWSMDDRDQEIELSNGLELKFNKEGDFLRLD